MTKGTVILAAVLAANGETRAHAHVDPLRGRAERMLNQDAATILCEAANRASLLRRPGGGSYECLAGWFAPDGTYAGPLGAPMRFFLPDYLPDAQLLRHGTPPADYIKGMSDARSVSAKVLANVLSVFGLGLTGNSKQDARLSVKFSGADVLAVSGVKAALYKGFDSGRVEAERGRRQLCQPGVVLAESIVVAKVQILVSYGSASAAEAALKTLTPSVGAGGELAYEQAMGEWLVISSAKPIVIGGALTPTTSLLDELCRPCEEPSECRASAQQLGWKWSSDICSWTSSVSSGPLPEGQEKVVADMCVPHEGADLSVQGGVGLEVAHHHVGGDSPWHYSNDCGKPPGASAPPGCIDRSAASWTLGSGGWRAIGTTPLAARTTGGRASVRVRMDQASVQNARNSDPAEVRGTTSVNLVLRPLRVGIDRIQMTALERPLH